MTKRLLTSLALATAVAVAGAACGHSPRLPAGTLSIGGADGSRVSLQVEIAETDQARQQGLMGRSFLDPDAGMVFLFDRQTSGGFWMKDTLIPLDIAFWAQGGRIVDVLRMTPCRSDPCRIYVPREAYFGAVEANVGFFASHGVGRGDVVRLARPATDG